MIPGCISDSLALVTLRRKLVGTKILKAHLSSVFPASYNGETDT